MEIRQAYSVEQTVYFVSQTDRVLIYVEFTAGIFLSTGASCAETVNLLRKSDKML